MSLFLTTLAPQPADSLKLLLARIAAAVGNGRADAEAMVSILPAAARTATTFGAILQVPSWAKGVAVRCNTTASSGTGGLQIACRLLWNATGTKLITGNTTTPWTTSAIRALLLGNFGNASAGYTQPFNFVQQSALTPYIQLGVLHGDASSYTYDLDAAFLR